MHLKGVKELQGRFPSEPSSTKPGDTQRQTSQSEETPLKRRAEQSTERTHQEQGNGLQGFQGQFWLLLGK